MIKARGLAWLMLFGMIISLIAILLSVPKIEAVDNNIILGAHRGDSLNYTENTLQAIQNALENPIYKFIEFDVQYTKDKKIVVFHDLSLFRLQRKSIKINELTYKELQNISEFEIPLYEQVMNLVENYKSINIEIKSQGNSKDDKEIADFIIKDCEKRNVLKDTVIISFSEDVIKHIEQKYPEIKTGMIYFLLPSSYTRSEESTKEFYEKVNETGTDYIFLYGMNVKNYEMLKKLKPEDKTLVFWYLDNRIYIVKDNCNAEDVKECLKSNQPSLSFF